MPVESDKPKVEGELRLMAVGDLMMGSDIRHGKAGRGFYGEEQASE